jgi:hypothetical protein
VACVLVAFGVLAQVRIGSELAPAGGTILNDTSAPVVVGPCRGGCTTTLARFEVAPGKTTRTGPAQADQRWLVLGQDGRRIGCLMPGSGASGSAQLRVSQARSC